jgi:hypothetical protein
MDVNKMNISCHCSCKVRSFEEMGYVRVNCPGSGYLSRWLGYGLDSQEFGVSFLARARESVMISSGPCSALYPVSTSFFLFTWVKRPWHETDHSALSSVEIKNAWSCTSLPHMSSWPGASLNTKTPSLFHLSSSFFSKIMFVGTLTLG